MTCMHGVPITGMAAVRPCGKCITHEEENALPAKIKGYIRDLMAFLVHPNDVWRVERERDALKADNGKLRDALRTIQDIYQPKADNPMLDAVREIARRALT